MMIELQCIVLEDLYNGVYKSIGIPIVFDYHHHKFCDGNMHEEEALKLSVSTWEYYSSCSLF